MLRHPLKKSFVRNQRVGEDRMPVASLPRAFGLRFVHANSLTSTKHGALSWAAGLPLKPIVPWWYDLSGKTTSKSDERLPPLLRRDFESPPLLPILRLAKLVECLTETKDLGETLPMRSEHTSTVAPSFRSLLKQVPARKQAKADSSPLRQKRSFMQRNAAVNSWRSGSMPGQRMPKHEVRHKQNAYSPSTNQQRICKVASVQCCPANKQNHS